MIVDMFPKEEVIRNSRKVLKDGFEADVYFPKYNLAVEAHGEYYHNDSVASRTYHMDKYEAALSNGVRLLQFFGGEIKSKTDAVRSIINKAMGNNPADKVYARRCKAIVKTEIPEEVRVFILNNSILFDVPKADKCICLYSKGRLVSVSLFKRITESYWELVNCTTDVKLNVVSAVPFSVQLLFKIDKNVTSVRTFVNLRYETEKEYEQMKFSYCKRIQPSFFWFLPLPPYRLSKELATKRTVLEMAEKYKSKLPKGYRQLPPQQILRKLNGSKVYDCGYVERVANRKDFI